MLLFALSIGASGCLVSSPPRLDPKDLVKVDERRDVPFEGVYTISAEKNSYVTITALGDGRYGVQQEWPGRPNETRHMTASFMYLHQITLVGDRTALRYLLILQQGAQVYYRNLIFEPAAGRYFWADYSLAEGNALTKSRSLKEAGLMLEDRSSHYFLRSADGGPPTSAQLKTLFRGSDVVHPKDFEALGRVR
jgi:hypothetical protein